MKLTAWRVALRIARRDALRAKGRSALVMAMIALPVLGVAGADIVYQSGSLDPGEKITRRMGTADAQISVWQQGRAIVQAPDPDAGSDLADRRERRPTPEEQRLATGDPAALLRTVLPAGSTVVPVISGPSVAATTVHGLARIETAEMDLTDPVWHGVVNLLDGRAPTRPQEIAATGAFLKESGLHLGDTTTVKGLTRPFTITAAVEYPGSLDSSELIAPPGKLIAPLAEASGKKDARAGWGGPLGGNSWLVRVPGGAGFTWPQVQKVNAVGFQVASRQVMLHPPARADVPYYRAQRNSPKGSLGDPVALTVLGTVAGMALLEIVLLAGPAFAVGARRSRRQLGLLAAGGGDRSHIRGVVLGGGVVLGIAGAVLGVALAAVTVAVGRPWLEDYAGQRFGHFDLHPLDLLGVAVIGLVTGVLAAVVPAVQASRQDVVAALTGRGSVKPPSKRLAVLGLLAVAAGAALAVLGAAAGQGTASVLGGSMLAELGMVTCTPFLVGLFGKLGRWLPLSPRLALRDSVRHRGRTAPAVAAVMAAVAGSVAVGLYSASTTADQRRDYQAMAPAGSVALDQIPVRADGGAALRQAEAAVESSIPGLGQRADISRLNYHGDCYEDDNCGDVSLVMPPERVCPLHGPGNFSKEETARLMREDARCRPANDPSYGSRFGSLLAGDSSVLNVLFGVHDPAAQKALAAGTAVVFDPRYVKDGKVTLELTEPWTDETGADGEAVKPKSHRVQLPAVVRTPATLTSQALLPAAAAQRAGLTVSPAGSLWHPATAPSGADEQRASAAVARITPDGSVAVERGFQGRSTLTTMGLTIFAALVALGAAGIATGLAAADSQQDLATLAAVGAAPRIRRTLSGFQCGVIAAMGAVLGALCGVVPAVALRKVEQAAAGAGRTVSIVFPWSQMALTVVVLPLIAVALAALLSRSRIALVRRTD
ncbi:FtsX-like permease family protein [Streptacidiphilus griseoplanus]|uniref:FtsX-like permease family protein n=1 Tax=Peterkaempfera griseoplana TaxID=66896 RepID=UPI0006E4602B|nr:FtsX-like permease family protein [Peterkaempfera griseoplana]